MAKRQIFAATALMSLFLGACATQQAMTVDQTSFSNPLPKYRNALAVRSVSGGQAFNVLTTPGVANEPLKAALESSLAASGYLAQSGAAKYTVDAEIRNLDQPLIGLDMDVIADVTYRVSGVGAAVTYPIKTKGSATFSDAPIGADRVRVANERALRENIREFIQGLR